MRTVERLKGLKAWIEKNLCDGRMMKAPPPDGSITDRRQQKPQCYLAWAPSRKDATGFYTDDSISVAPGIIVMPRPAYAEYMEEKRFDRYNNVHRPSLIGSHLSVDILFIVYEPGIQLPGFIDSAGENGEQLDMSLIKEGTEEGLFTLLDWMDDCKEALLRDEEIPNTDLMVDKETVVTSLYSDQNYVVDRRPLFYGFVSVTFNGYADRGRAPSVDSFLQ